MKDRDAPRFAPAAWPQRWAPVTVVSLGVVLSLLLAGFVPGSGAVAARRVRADAVGARLDSALRSVRRRLRAPGAAAAVVACGRVVWSGVSGMSDLRSRRPVTAGTRFVLASTTKTITATMLMQEVQAGRLSLATRLSRFYPRLPNARRISVRMLLDMTSGLPEYFDNHRVSYVIYHRPRHHWTRSQVLTGFGTGLGKALFPPGDRFRYTDTNYVVLGGILERISGASIERDFEHMIATPAGMTSSTFTPTRAGTRRLAHPYVQANNGSRSSYWIKGFGLPRDYWGPVWTDGGLASTAADLARFGNALLGGRLVSAATLAQMTNVGPHDYGLGIYGQSFDGHHWLGHDGDYDGYESENWTDRARRVTIAVTANLEESDNAADTVSDRIWRAIVRAYDSTASPACHGAPSQ